MQKERGGAQKCEEEEQGGEPPTAAANRKPQPLTGAAAGRNAPRRAPQVRPRPAHRAQQRGHRVAGRAGRGLVGPLPPQRGEQLHHRLGGGWGLGGLGRLLLSGGWHRGGWRVVLLGFWGACCWLGGSRGRAVVGLGAGVALFKRRRDKPPASAAASSPSPVGNPAARPKAEAHPARRRPASPGASAARRAARRPPAGGPRPQRGRTWRQAGGYGRGLGVVCLFGWLVGWMVGWLVVYVDYVVFGLSFVDLFGVFVCFLLGGCRSGFVWGLGGPFWAASACQQRRLRPVVARVRCDRCCIAA